MVAYRRKNSEGSHSVQRRNSSDRLSSKKSNTQKEQVPWPFVAKHDSSNSRPAPGTDASWPPTRQATPEGYQAAGPSLLAGVKVVLAEAPQHAEHEALQHSGHQTAGNNEQAASQPSVWVSKDGRAIWVLLKHCALCRDARGMAGWLVVVVVCVCVWGGGTHLEAVCHNLRLQASAKEANHAVLLNHQLQAEYNKKLVGVKRHNRCLG